MISNLEIGNSILDGHVIRAIREAVDGCLVLVATSAFEYQEQLCAVTMQPVKNGREWHCQAEGAWNLLVQTRTPLRRSNRLRTRMRGVFGWLRGLDLNQRPLGYEPNELPGCSTPHFYLSKR